ncbi:Na(+)/H(+) antiporter subunit A, partial [Aquimarina celericrescens]|nr:Na(+)/H(+) antiporter subunit A [Aquimarina celericrescens]
LSEGFAEFSRLWTNFFQTGYLRHYISVIVAFLILLLGYLIFSDFSLTLDFSTLADLTIYEISILLMLLMGVLYTVFTKSRLAAVAAL